MASVEGEKEIEMALLAGLEFHSLFFLGELVNQELAEAVASKHEKAEIMELDKSLFDKVTYRESTVGMIAVVRTRTLSLDQIQLPPNPLLLIVEAVEKPGNLGAILRTADAAAIDAVICCDIPSDIYNPNVIRSSLGTIFSVPVAMADNKETMEWLRKNRIRTFCTNLHQASDYYLQDYTQASAIIVGTEATGVSGEWIDFADHNVKIPMLGQIDSMNVSVASAIMLYEAKRQRKFT